MLDWISFRSLRRCVTFNHNILKIRQQDYLICKSRIPGQRSHSSVLRDLQVCGLKPKSKCRTVGLRLNGAHGWSPNLFIQLSQEYGIDRDVAIHLASTYGGHAVRIAQQAKLTGRRYPLAGRRLHPDFPIIEAEVSFRRVVNEGIANFLKSWDSILLINLSGW